jgi:hypothetical protein
MIGANGQLLATNAILDNITISGKSYFNGNILAGPLYASNEIINAVPGTTFSSDKTVQQVWAFYGGPNVNSGADQEKTIDVTGGSYGDYNDLTRIVFTYDYTPGGQARNIFTMYLYFRTHSTIIIRGTSNPNNPNPVIGNTLVIGGGNAGKTFRLYDLPGHGDQKGDVWVSTDGLLHIVL